MKKIFAALCGALAVAAFAEPAAPGGDAPARRRPAPPLVLNLDKATPEQIEQFKKDVIKKIDEAVAAGESDSKGEEAKCDCGKEGCAGGPECKCGDEKCKCGQMRVPRVISLFVSKGGMTPRRMGRHPGGDMPGRGPRGDGMHGWKRDGRGGHGAKKDGAPAPGAPAPDAPAPDAPPPAVPAAE